MSLANLATGRFDEHTKTIRTRVNDKAAACATSAVVRREICKTLRSRSRNSPVDYRRLPWCVPEPYMCWHGACQWYGAPHRVQRV